MIKSLLFFALCFAPVAAIAQYSPASNPDSRYNTPTPVPDSAMLASATRWFAQLQAGKIDRSQLTPQMNAALSDAQLKNLESSVANLGTPVSFDQQLVFSQAGFTYALYRLTFANGATLGFVFAVDAERKVSGMRLTGAP